MSAAAGEGCDCTELCSMGPTCLGGMLAGLAGSGCWRSAEGAATGAVEALDEAERASTSGATVTGTDGGRV